MLEATEKQERVVCSGAARGLGQAVAFEQITETGLGR